MRITTVKAFSSFARWVERMLATHLPTDAMYGPTLGKSHQINHGLK